MNLPFFSTLSHYGHRFDTRSLYLRPRQEWKEGAGHYFITFDSRGVARSRPNDPWHRATYQYRKCLRETRTEGRDSRRFDENRSLYSVIYVCISWQSFEEAAVALLNPC